ncbi:MAG: MATE family efflux transporter [Oscillospiraceae bacterium]|nr:MATE family efflux transporter [Oscillospiraceae bacterium]
MGIRISDHFDIRRLARFVMPSVVMMIFTSIYSVVDGLFVSNFVDTTAFAAINFIMPVLMIFGAIGFMLGAGGSALVSKTFGEGRQQKANEIFSMLVYVGIGLGVVLAVSGGLLVRPAAALMGAEGELLDRCVMYARIVLCALPFFMLQNMFQSFLVTAGRPKLGLKVTVCAGVLNMVLDALLIVVLKWGLAGAAIATAMSQTFGGLLPLLFFARENDSTLRLGRMKMDWRALGHACGNGSSEFVTNISMSVVGVLYNVQLLAYAGQDGIAAYGVIMYVSFFFVAIFLGYSIGVSPIIGYNYGAENHAELKNVFEKSMKFVALAGVVLTALSYALAAPVAWVFVGEDAALCRMTAHAFRINAFSFLLCGFGIFGSALFTALNNGVISALISFLRMFLFQAVTVLVMPMIWEVEGIWYAVVVAEGLAAIVSLALIAKYKKRYNI